MIENQKTKEELIAKLKKLLALQQGAEEIGSQAEAENAAMRVQEFLIKYNLSLEDTLNQREKSEYLKQIINWHEYWRKTESDWVPRLYNVLANHNFCKVIREADPSVHYLYAIGEPHNLDIIQYFASTLIPQVRKMASKSFSQYQGPEKKNTYIRGYLRGVVTGISEKLKAQKAQMEQESNKVTALVVVKDNALREAVNTYFPRLTKASSSSLNGLSGFNQGKADGKNINLTRGINSNKTNNRLL